MSIGGASKSHWGGRGVFKKRQTEMSHQGKTNLLVALF